MRFEIFSKIHNFQNLVSTKTLQQKIGNYSKSIKTIQLWLWEGNVSKTERKR